MIRLAKALLHWYEKTAHKYVKGALPNQDDPITLDRLWEVCKKYLLGAPPESVWGEGDYPIYFRYPNINWFSLGNSKSKSKSKNQSFITAFFIALATICVAILLTVWVLSGIAFQHVIRNIVPSTMHLVQNTFSGLIGILGAAAGVAIGSTMGIFSNYKNTYLEFIQAGADIGYNMGSKAGEWLGWFASIAIIPAAIVVSLPLGIAVGLPMGALTLVVAPLQFIKTTYNYINSKFEEELQSKNNAQQPEDDQQNRPTIIQNAATDTLKPNSPVITNLKDARDAEAKNASRVENEASQKPCLQEEPGSNSLSLG